MPIKIINYTNDFRPSQIEMINIFCKHVYRHYIKDAKVKITVYIKQDIGIPYNGIATRNSDNSITIRLYANRLNFYGNNSIFVCAMHELIHAKQYIQDRLKGDPVIPDMMWFDGKAYDNNVISYVDAPWEIEAFTNQVLLAQKYVNDNTHGICIKEWDTLSGVTINEKYRIYVRKQYREQDEVEFLFHEMWHYYQYVTRRLTYKGDKTYFTNRGSNKILTIDVEKTAYADLPYEKEAFYMQRVLMKEYKDWKSSQKTVDSVERSGYRNVYSMFTKGVKNVLEDLKKAFDF